MKNLKRYFLLILSILLAGWISRTQDQDYDIAFVKDAAVSGLFEVQAGKLAMSKATLPEVKSFGQKMVNDHSKANEELRKLAATKNISIPDSLDAKMKATYDSIALTKGRNFDEVYIQQMVKAHQIDVNKFEAATKSLVDADIRAWAFKTLPVLKMHNKHVQQVKTNLGNENKGKKNDKKDNKGKKS